MTRHSEQWTKSMITIMQTLSLWSCVCIHAILVSDATQERERERKERGENFFVCVFVFWCGGFVCDDFITQSIL